MREGYFLVRASVWGRPQKFSKGFAARQQKLRLRPTRGLDHDSMDDRYAPEKDSRS